MKNIYVVILILLILYCPLAAFSQEEEPAGKTETDYSFSSLKKSLLIPGWGQAAEKRYVEGFLFFSAEVFSFYQIFSNNHKGNKYYRKYQGAGSMDATVQYRALTAKYDKRRNIYILAAVGIWAVNLIDIYVIVKRKAKRKLELKLESGKDKSLAFTVSYSF